jgi:hypothetical protein
MKQNNILEVPFWKVAIRFSSSFLVLLALFLSGVSYFKAESQDAFTDAIDASIEDGTWVNFVMSKVAVAIVYGVAMAYFSRKKAEKLQGKK